MRTRFCAATLLLAALGGCEKKNALEPNPLAQADPSQGFVSESFVQSGSMMDDALVRNGVADPDRVAFAADATGVARLAAQVDVANGCAQPPCNVSAKLTLPLVSASQSTALLATIGAAHVDALERWGSIGAAHAALGIANLLDQGKHLDSAARIEIQAKAAAFHGSNPQSYETLDWSLTAGQLDPLLLADLTGHAPVKMPPLAAAVAADAIVSSVVTQVARLFNGGPIPELCCSARQEALPPNSDAYQTLRRLGILQQWNARSTADTSQTWAAALATLAGNAAGNGTSSAIWADYFTGTVPHTARIGRAIAAIDAGNLIAHPRFDGTIKLPTPTFVDGNAGGFQPNASTGLDAASAPQLALQNGAPFLELDVPMLPFLPIHFTPSIPAIPTPAPPHDGASPWAPAGPRTIGWTIGSSAAIDHLDLRVLRGTTPVAHWVERPDSATGNFPSRTVFDPLTMDAGHPNPAVGAHAETVYSVYAIAVDVRGRASSRKCLDVDVRFDGSPDPSAATMQFRSGDAAPISDCDSFQSFEPAEFELTLSDNTMVIRNYTYEGVSYRHYSPTNVRLAPSDTTLTIQNLDSSDVQIRSVYTPPYVEFLPIDLAIGGISPIDSGVLSSGASFVLTLPPALPPFTEWRLYDLTASSTGETLHVRQQ